jgi:glycosyltransferase involved in cell wall biosynthesis
MNQQVQTNDKIIVGMPIYNRSKNLLRAIKSIQNQSHRELEIHIYDNKSTNIEVFNIINRQIAGDSRLKYHVNEKNIGAIGNFRRAALRSNAKYFMWAADDDYWHPNFINDLVQMHRSDPSIGLAFCGLEVQNSFGRIVGSINRFPHFNSTDDSIADLARFVADPEIGGKANMIYGVFLHSALQETLGRVWLPPDIGGANSEDQFNWGDDNALLVAFLSRYRVRSCSKILFRKTRHTDSENLIDYTPVWYSRGPGLKEYPHYRDRLIDAAPSKKQKEVVKKVMNKRIIIERYMGLMVRPIIKTIRKIRIEERT